MLREMTTHPEDIVAARMCPPRAMNWRTGHERAHIGQTRVGLEQQPVPFERRQYALRVFTTGDHYFVPCVSMCKSFS